MKKFLLICFSVMTFFAMSLTTFAAENDFPKFSPQSGYDYIEYGYESSDSTMNYYVLTWNSTNVETVKYKNQSSPYLQFHGVAGSEIFKYEYNPTRQTWSIDSDSTVTLGTTGNKNINMLLSNLIKTTVNITDLNSGELVFPLPPNLREVTEMGLQEMSKSLGQVVSIVVPCGVGCLALLIGCHLLRKKSALWLNR